LLRAGVSGGAGNGLTAKEVPLQPIQRSASTGILLLVGLALILLPALSEAQVTQPLTAEQVHCSADQLRAILGRSAVLFGPAYNDQTVTFLFTYAGGSNELSGLALMEQEDTSGRAVGADRQLLFSVLPSPSRLRRNPAKPQLSSFNLIRDMASSDPSRLEDPFAMAVVIDPTVDPQKNESFAALLAIDNLSLQEGGITSDGKTGRGLQALLERCPATTFTKADLHVFDVLTRMLRTTAWSTKRTDKKAERLHKLAAIYRGEEASTLSTGTRTSYRIDLFPLLEKTTSRVSLELLVDLGQDGTLGDATLRVLPACAAEGDRDCTTATSEVAVSIIHPISGQQKWTAEAGKTVCWKGPASCPGEVTFSFAERLKGTSWLKR
jgi:hypothetical protein